MVCRCLEQKQCYTCFTHTTRLSGPAAPPRRIVCGRDALCVTTWTRQRKGERKRLMTRNKRTHAIVLGLCCFIRWQSTQRLDLFGKVIVPVMRWKFFEILKCVDTTQKNHALCVFLETMPKGARTHTLHACAHICITCVSLFGLGLFVLVLFTASVLHSGNDACTQYTYSGCVSRLSSEDLLGIVSCDIVMARRTDCSNWEFDGAENDSNPSVAITPCSVCILGVRVWRACEWPKAILSICRTKT